MLRVLDLFSGIGGFSLWLERTGGFQTVAFCEIDPFCRRVLAKHWPDVPIFEDVRELTADTLSGRGIAVDAICGGFPCQDVSQAGKRAGLEDTRSGLWFEYARLIGELRPGYVIVENVPGLLSLGMGDVLGKLAALGYNAFWDCVPASAVGAPHRRDRVWLVAYPGDDRQRQPLQQVGQQGGGAAPYSGGDGEIQSMADANGPKRRSHAASRGRVARQQRVSQRQEGAGGLGASGANVAHADGDQRHGRSSSVQVGRGWFAGEAEDDGLTGGAEWRSEPNVGRVAHGVPSRVDRLRSLGNAVVPQIPELIGRAILQAHGLKSAEGIKARGTLNTNGESKNG